MTAKPKRRPRPWYLLEHGPPPDWCPQNRLIGWITYPPGREFLLLAGVLGLALMIPARWPCLVLLAGGWLVRQVHRWGWRGRVKGWQVCEAGLRELLWWAPARLHPWATIREVVSTPDSLSVVTDSRTLALPINGRGAPELARRLRDGLAAEPPSAEPVSPSQIAEWLGIEEDQELRIATQHWPWPWRRTITPSELVFGLLPFYLVGASGYGQLLLLLMVVGALRLRWLKRTPLRVTARGLSRGAAWHAGWDDVERVVQDGTDSGQWTLITHAGVVVLAGTEAPRIVETVGKVLAAKRSGAVLPRMTDIPDHALSRAESSEVSAERGISPAEGDAP